MSYPIFPVSPLPANTERVFNWGAAVTEFDSGAAIGVTPYQRPLMRYSVPLTNFNELRQGSLQAFVNTVRGRTHPWLVKDPYDHRVNSVLAVRSGYGSGSGALDLFDTNSFFVRADTTTVGSLFSSLSGYVTLGAEYSYDQDTGRLTVNTKAPNDVWGVRSMEYFRKCRFSEDYRETATIWNIFNAQLRFNEEA